ncbi:hypothetical protein DFH06DRAFT_1442379 [Mycena polygramma]|nr:hypothetical protein DFH06DRAFT_1442379 [Mycena polygramma]
MRIPPAASPAPSFPAIWSKMQRSVHSSSQLNLCIALARDHRLVNRRRRSPRASRRSNRTNLNQLNPHHIAGQWVYAVVWAVPNADNEQRWSAPVSSKTPTFLALPCSIPVQPRQHPRGRRADNGAPARPDVEDDGPRGDLSVPLIILHTRYEHRRRSIAISRMHTRRTRGGGSTQAWKFASFGKYVPLEDSTQLKMHGLTGCVANRRCVVGFNRKAKKGFNSMVRARVIPGEFEFDQNDCIDVSKRQEKAMSASPGS